MAARHGVSIRGSSADSTSEAAGDDKVVGVALGRGGRVEGERSRGRGFGVARASEKGGVTDYGSMAVTVA
ncbi:hypothetical protein E2562_017125 [Oryza meyeriana var. granulata]|uniref:DUF834 domain-containing protein n=1 Tax=Oryza meyeriana var. granulata TaxID=110450 RepID=A0A6G1DYN4_9ORYZ|nr:hypothetical protein E2562_017125 [Oryza meyeriana var. granulata]